MIADEYRSSIPESATERVTEWHENGQKKQAKYLVASKVVGMRYFFESGDPEDEFPQADGVAHGIQYRWHSPGVLLSANPYLHGLEHGIARQWTRSGALIGGYTMEHGTGLDLWWNEWEDGTPYLVEARYLLHDQRHGFEWWINDDQATVRSEEHFQHGRAHGIEHRWDRDGSLERDFPRFYIAGNRVSEAEYIRACESDTSLPPYRKEDNRPARTFPPEVARHLGPSSSGRDR